MTEEVDQALAEPLVTFTVLESESPEFVAVVRAAARHAARVTIYERYANPSAGPTQSELPPRYLAIRPITSYAFLCQLPPTRQMYAVVKEEADPAFQKAFQDYAPQIGAEFAKAVYGKLECMLTGVWSQLTACCTSVITAAGPSVSPTLPIFPSVNGRASGGISSGARSSNAGDVDCSAGSESNSCIASTRTSIALTHSATAGSNGLHRRIARERLSQP